MMQVLKTLRDFLTPEALAWLPGRLHARTCLLLHVSNVSNLVEASYSTTTTTVQRIEDHYYVFDEGGTYIGEVIHPEWWPGACRAR